MPPLTLYLNVENVPNPVRNNFEKTNLIVDCSLIVAFVVISHIDSEEYLAKREKHDGTFHSFPFIVLIKTFL